MRIRSPLVKPPTACRIPESRQRNVFGKLGGSITKQEGPSHMPNESCADGCLSQALFRGPDTGLGAFSFTVFMLLNCYFCFTMKHQGLLAPHSFLLSKSQEE